MKNILLLVHDDAGQEARLQAALDLVAALKGHLVCLDVVGLPVMASDYFSDVAQVAMVEEELARESEHCARIEERLEKEGIPFEMLRASGDLADCIVRNAGLADLIVVNRKMDDPFAPEMRSVASAIALKARKPIVAVPETARRFDVNGPVLVAWDGSSPAMAALTAAVPLLKLARTVVLFEVEDGTVTPPAEEAAAYLSRHGIHPTIEREARGPRQVDDHILDAIERYGATYCVMGAFGQSPLRQALFGGVTRRMLATTPVPLVIVH